MNDTWTRHRGIFVVLAAAALGVWGLFAWRLVGELTRDGETAARPRAVTQAGPGETADTARVTYFTAGARDPFRPPWLRPRQAARSPDRPRPAPRVPPPQGASPPALTLHGVVGQTALLQDGTGPPRLLRTGEVIAEARLVRVDRDGVELVWRDRRLVLDLAP